MAVDPRFHLAQLNIGRIVAPLDAPELKEFVDFLGPVNAQAEQMPGFVWRLTGPGNEPSSFLASPFEDPLMITNMSVWTDLDALRAFLYDTVHRYFLQSRRKWFEKLDQRYVVLWWVQAGHVPTLDEALARLGDLERRGSTPDAFSLQEPFGPDRNPLPRPVRQAAAE